MSTSNLSVKRDIKTPKPNIKTDSKKARQAALAAIVKGVQASAGRIESYLPTLLNNALESKTWDWPRETYRKNGSVAGRTRDIVDTGRLKDSLKVSTKFLKTKTTFTIDYSAPYATFVHEGGYITPYGDTTRDSVYAPGRPWVTAVLQGGFSGIESIDMQTEFLIGIPSKW